MSLYYRISRLGSFALFLIRHCCQPLYFLYIQLEPFGRTAAVNRVGLEEKGCLAELDALLCASKMRDNIAYQMVFITVSHHLSVKVAGCTTR